MVKRSPNYILVVLMFLFGTGATQWAHSVPARVSFSADLKAFPTSLGSWRGRVVPLDSQVESALNADEILSRSYTDLESGGSLGMLVVYRKYGRRDFAHRPEMCYPASGWEIMDKRYTTVPYGGRNVPARMIVAQKDDAREVVLYWFASGERTEANYVKQQLWMSLDRLRPRKYGWAFIRINMPVAYSEDETLGQIRAFLSAASNPLVGVLTESQ